MLFVCGRQSSALWRSWNMNILDQIVGRFPVVVHTGDTVPLTVELTTRTVGAGDTLSSATVVDHDGIDILVLIQSPGFTHETDGWQTIHVPREGAAATAT